MAPPSRRTTPSLIDSLRQTPHRFEFFQAVRLMQLQYGPRRDRDAPALQPVGHDAGPDGELLRFRPPASRSFPPSEIAELALPEPPGEAGQAPTPGRMTVGFMGLYGPSGVLPLHYTQDVIDEAKTRRATPLRDFLDIFNHRALSMFFRAWEKYRLAIVFENLHRLQTGQTDWFTEAILALVGLSPVGTRRRLAVADEAFLYFAGAFSRHPRNASALSRALSEFFGLPFRVRQFQGEWLTLAPQQASRMPRADQPRTVCHNRLGVDTIAGSRVWSVEGRVRIQIGPVDYRTFTELMPGGERLVQISQFVRQYLGPVLETEYQVVLAAGETPPLELSPPNKNSPGPRLGHNTWLWSRPLDGERGEAVFRCWGDPAAVA